MRIIMRTLMALGFSAATLAYGSVPSLNVIVSDSSGKTAFKGVTSAKGTFATGTLKPGGYTVQFNSSATPSGTFALVVSAGSKKVTAGAVAGAKFAKGGVAMKIDVGSGLNITGQVAADDKNSAPLGRDGKPMVWIPKKLGSNIAAHWAESDSAEAKEAMTTTSYSAKNLQDKQNQGIAPH
ncbi:MAG TPA: hypothetical protein VGW57_11685 [Chthoniobacterales bacterium]|nr:hypothetical protein [Chthoniobacterales bacterium]